MVFGLDARNVARVAGNVVPVVPLGHGVGQGLVVGELWFVTGVAWDLLFL